MQLEQREIARLGTICEAEQRTLQHSLALSSENEWTVGDDDDDDDDGPCHSARLAVSQLVALCAQKQNSVSALFDSLWRHALCVRHWFCPDIPKAFGVTSIPRLGKLKSTSDASGLEKGATSKVLGPFLRFWCRPWSGNRSSTRPKERHM